MEVENDVMNQIVKKAQKVKPINVNHMEAESDVRIVKIGQIREVEVQNMTDIAQLVLSVFSQMTTVV